MARPAPAAARTAPTAAVCGSCGAHTDCWPARQGVSKVFAGYDTWTHLSQPWLCGACLWAYSTPALRQHPHLVSHDHLETLDPAEAGRLLASSTLSPDQALVVPLRPGRRHLLPQARWGHVCTEHGCLPWTSTDAHLLTTYTWLRRLGFTPTDLEHPAPAWSTQRTHPASERAHVITIWQHLAPWRCPDSPWLALASRTTQEAHR